MIKQIKNTYGNWPTSNETLLNNYLEIFVKIRQIRRLYRSAMALYYKRQIPEGVCQYYQQ